MHVELITAYVKPTYQSLRFRRHAALSKDRLENQSVLAVLQQACQSGPASCRLSIASVR